MSPLSCSSFFHCVFLFFLLLLCLLCLFVLYKILAPALPSVDRKHQLPDMLFVCVLFYLFFFVAFLSGEPK